jgi:hypothetical protein
MGSSFADSIGHVKVEGRVTIAELAENKVDRVALELHLAHISRDHAARCCRRMGFRQSVERCSVELNCRRLVEVTVDPKGGFADPHLGGYSWPRGNLRSESSI